MAWENNQANGCEKKNINTEKQCITSFLCNRQHFQRNCSQLNFTSDIAILYYKKLRVRMKYSIYILNFMHCENKKKARKTLIMMLLLHSNTSSFHTYTHTIYVYLLKIF